jgi:valyl-tRNA synthetase
MIFDTWFSSWLWAISSFESDEERKYFGATDIIITGEDIAFFWIAKMIMANAYLEKDIPFKNIYFTGIMRDEHGRKISKQFNNSPDILKIMEEHGADSLRFGLIIGHQPGLDEKFQTEKIQGADKIIQGKKFCNKIWNIDRLINEIWKGNESTSITESQQEAFEKWADALENKSSELRELMAQNRFSDALRLIYNLIWEDFSSQLLEKCKPIEGTFPNMNKELYDGINDSFRQLNWMLEPFMPFITNHMISKNEQK